MLRANELVAVFLYCNDTAYYNNVYEFSMITNLKFLNHVHTILTCNIL